MNFLQFVHRDTVHVQFSSSDTWPKKYASKVGNLIKWKHSERDNTAPPLGDISGTKSLQHYRLTALNMIFLTTDHSTHETEEVVRSFLNKGLCLNQLIFVTSCGNCSLRQGFCSTLASITAQQMKQPVGLLLASTLAISYHKMAL